MYLRFATYRMDERALREEGVFQAAYDLLDGGELNRAERAWLLDALDHFERVLRVPRVWEPRAIFWFKHTCPVCTGHVWNLVHAVRDLGVAVRVIRTAKPGQVVYEDSCQVAAIPWRDTFVNRTRRPTRHASRIVPEGHRPFRVRGW